MIFLSLASAFLAASAVAQEAPRFVRGPYLEGVARDSAHVCWRSDVPAFARVELRPSRRSGDDWAPTVKWTLVDRRGSRCHEFRGLVASTSYDYRVFLSSEPSVLSPAVRASAFQPLRSSGLAERSLAFAVIGDTGQGTPAQRRVAQALAREAPEFVLHLGDVVYPKGSDKDYDEMYFAPYGLLIASVPVYFAVGNHDYGNIRFRRGAGRRWLEGNFLSVHRLPASATPVPAEDAPRTYYSFDRGPAHFAVLDSNRVFPIRAAPSIAPGSPQLAWLESDLAASKAPWKFVVLHRPLYSTARHGEEERLQRDLAPILERRGVDVVFSGHDHHYERTIPIRGVVYVVAGNGGAALHTGSRSRPWSALRAARHGFLQVRLDGRRLSLEAVADDGAVMDRWAKTK